MEHYNLYTLKEYLDALSRREPVPGGGSAAALTAALGAALISMVAQYSLGRKAGMSDEKPLKDTLKKSEHIRRRLLKLVDLDAEAYLRVVRARKNKSSSALKRAALKKARDVPLEVSRLCYTALLLTPLLVKKGNPYLISDIEVAVELLFAAYKSAMINVAIN